MAIATTEMREQLTLGTGAAVQERRQVGVTPARDTESVWSRMAVAGAQITQRQATGEQAGRGGGRARAQTADVAAKARALFESLFERYQDALYQYVHRLMGDPDDALDFTQEAFLRAYRGLPAMLASGRPVQARAWLYRIATNVCLDELRRRRLIRWQSWDSFAAAFHPSQVAGDDPVRDVLRHEAAEEVQAVLARMHPRYRVCLVLREYQGLSYQEIAEATGCSPEAIKTVLFRAREDFRRKYRQVHPGKAPGQGAEVLVA